MGRKATDLTGMRFGMLTVIERTEKPEHIKGRGAYWLCKCECGNITKPIQGGNLKSGNTTNCGCSRAEDLIGMKFGRLTVIERAENKGKKVTWICKCECGNITKPIQGGNLKNGNTTSCGCYNSEKSSERMSIMVKEQWKDEDFRKMQSERMKEKWQDEDYRKMQSEKGKEQWKNNNFRQMKIEQMKQRTGNKNPSWKGGITPITDHLRKLNSQWFDLCKQQANYTCQLTGKRGNGDLNTHHLYAFSSIVKDAHTTNNIEIKQQVKDYTQEELQLLEQFVAEWHQDNSNAVVLCEEVHTLFHQEYGYGDNTPQQYEEFRQRYLAGEFNNLDSMIA